MSLNEDNLFYNPILYWLIVGMFQYLSFTRIYIVYSINQISQFIHAPTDYYMEVVKRILRYLNGTIGEGPPIPVQISLFVAII